MEMNEIARALARKIQDVRENEPMSGHTSFGVGGPADVMVLPQTEAEIDHAVQTMAQLKLPIFVMGNGSNLLATSKGIRGVVMKLADNFAGVEADGQYVTAKSGTSLSALVRDAAHMCLGGVEFLGGIPGTVGGAVYMNAGAYEEEIGSFVEEVYFSTHSGMLTMRGDEMQFGHRTSLLHKVPLVVTGVKLKLKDCETEDCICKINELNGQRREKQPLEYPSAGSAFKRPEGHFAGALIEQAGLKGLSIGGAQVSEKHAGFVINKGGATSEDIISLIEEVQRRVKEHSGVALEPEVRIVGQR